MAVLIAEAPESLVADALPHKTWTRDEVAVLESTGLFDDAHFELIDGELIDKMGKKQPHVKAAWTLTLVLGRLFGLDFVRHEAPMDVAADDNARNEPEPDVMVLRRSYLEFDANPRPDDAALVVEVADSSLRQDLVTKARLYARAGIPEYWVLDVNHRLLYVHREPSEGQYRQRVELRDGDSVAPLAKPEGAIAVSSLLP